MRHLVSPGERGRVIEFRNWFQWLRARHGESYILAVCERATILATFFGASLATGWDLNQLAIYAWSPRWPCWISRRLANTPFQFFARNQKAFSEVCSHSRQHVTTTMSRAVMETKFRQYRSEEMFLMRIRKRFFTECMLISGGSARRLPARTWR